MNSQISGCGNCFFFNDTATTEIYTLSLHDALPILDDMRLNFQSPQEDEFAIALTTHLSYYLALSFPQDRKSTRLNSSH